MFGLNTPDHCRGRLQADHCKPCIQRHPIYKGTAAMGAGWCTSARCPNPCVARQMALYRTEASRYCGGDNTGRRHGADRVRGGLLAAPWMQDAASRPPICSIHTRPKGHAMTCQIIAIRRSCIPEKSGWCGCNGRWKVTTFLRPNLGRRPRGWATRTREARRRALTLFFVKL